MVYKVAGCFGRTLQARWHKQDVVRAAIACHVFFMFPSWSLRS